MANLQDELNRATRQMREAQKEYFKTRNSQVLQASKGWEKRVDKLLEQLPDPDAKPTPAQHDLFGNPI